MKSILIILVGAFAFLSFKLDVSDDVVNALKQGKIAEVTKLLDEKVSVKIQNQEDVLSKQQAEANISYFFEKHQVKNFTTSKINSINNISQYIIGTLETSNGKFKVSILLRRNLIAQFRVEEENE
ncbi:MAG: DUF4783 domain-containing protein [Bacteroidetes bacterium]|nr:DUF4783 domain-containing protein [Bacteroidota bacterium]